MAGVANPLSVAEWLGWRKRSEASALAHNSRRRVDGLPLRSITTCSRCMPAVVKDAPNGGPGDVALSANIVPGFGRAG